MSIPFFQIDAFASRAFEGNPAAVCLLEEPADADWMQNVAVEMNLSETAFVVRNQSDSAAPYGLRWFTPFAEVDLCGHATVATSHALWDFGWHDPGSRIEFESRSGRLSAERVGEFVELNFPRRFPKEATPHPELFSAMGVSGAEFVGNDVEDTLVQLDSESAVRNLKPDFVKLAQLGGRGLLVTAESSGDEFDFVSRCFFPQVGINEDPVTGSAHCSLADFWGTRLGKNTLTGFQASQRGGIVQMELVDDRVKLRGKAITVVSGQLLA